MEATSNATTENSDLVNGAHLETDDWLASPKTISDAEDEATATENIHTDTAKEPLMKEPLVLITDWDPRALPSQEEESLRRSRYRLGGSADSILSLTSSHSLLPLEWKILRSSQSESTLAHFSDATLENTEGGHKDSSDNNQDVVDDIIGDEVAFKVCTRMLNHSLGAAYTADSRTAFPVIHNGSPSPKDANYSKKTSDSSQCKHILHPRTEKFPDVGMQVNQAHNSAADRKDSSLTDQLWTAAASAKNLHNIAVSNGWEGNSYHHKSTKKGRSPAMSGFLLKSPDENKQEFHQPMKNVQAKRQVLLNGQSPHADDGKLYGKEIEFLNEERSTCSLPKFECNSPRILQQQIVNLKSQINNLQEANETAVLELAKADEEISQLKNEMAQLKSEYMQKLADSKEENLNLKKKINRMHSRHDPVDTYEQTLHEEICELRAESRRLREIGHQLNEENHRLKEELWDVKRKYEWLMHTVAGKQDEKIQECSRKNASSPSSINSESTEFLISGYCDTGLAKENRDLKDDASEEVTKASSNNFPCITQHNQTSHENYDQNISSSSSSGVSQVDTCNKYYPNSAPNKGVFVNFSKIIIAWE
ncbi:glycerol kinase isoform X5 [Podarcis raffonei]|uniref:glycerol kinase isoform X5 n=1 Tax=Podarcis raffonei TaxID=65483 RepID=UPI0023299498|nr:glycerol kinase isoform X5 [Podarcis raffonei]